MGRKWEDIKRPRTPEEEAESQAWVDAELAKLPFSEIHRAREMTRERLGEVLELDRQSVARMERWADVYLATLRSYIEAQGGVLEIVARFPNGELLMQRFTDNLRSVRTQESKEESAAVPAA